MNLALRRQRDCDSLTMVTAEGRNYVRGYSKLPPIRVDERDRGNVALSFVNDGVRVDMAFVRDANQRWSVKRLERFDASGKPAPPASNVAIEEDRQDINECWETLGKKRPTYPTEE